MCVCRLPWDHIYPWKQTRASFDASIRFCNPKRKEMAIFQFWYPLTTGFQWYSWKSILQNLSFYPKHVSLWSHRKFSMGPIITLWVFKTFRKIRQTHCTLNHVRTTHRKENFDSFVKSVASVPYRTKLSPAQ